MAKENSKPTRADEIEKPRCGLVMPISAIDGCSEQHWGDVKAILTEAVESVGFAANLVSDADDVGIIQKRIIQNLYENPIVVCDVSGKNPNVMFELGMRLAFDKPTIIIKDDKTSYSFDTSPIEHLEYPRDLRFGRIVDFKQSLGAKVGATHEKATTDKNYTTFLKHFGKFTIAQLDTTVVSKEDYIIEELRELRHYLSRREFMERKTRPRGGHPTKAQVMIREAVRDVIRELSKDHGGVELPDQEDRILAVVADRLDGLALCSSREEFEDLCREAIYS